MFDYQTASNLAAAAQFNISGITDLKVRYPISNHAQVAKVANGPVMVSGKGKMYVRTDITTATGGVTARDFGVGLIMKMSAAGDHDVFVNLQARLHNEEIQVLQPRK